MEWPRTIAALACAVMSLCGGPAIAADPATHPVPTNLRFEVTSAKDQYVRNEPIILVFGLENTGATPEAVRTSLMLASGDIELYVTEPTGRRRRFHPPVFFDVVSPEVELSPGERVEASSVVQYNELEHVFTFSNPGVYRIEASVCPFGGANREHVDADPIQVTIVTPSEIDRLFTERFGSEGKLLDFLGNGSSSYCADKAAPGCFEELNALAVHLADSAYAPFVEYYLAREIENRTLEIEPKWSVVIDLLEDFLKRWPEHGLRAGALTHLALASAENGGASRAREVAALLESEFPARRTSLETLRKMIGKGSHDEQ